jgi:hypothetical protein
MPATEIKKTKMSVKYIHSEYSERNCVGLIWFNGKSSEDGM